jgi:hypothetical protein
MTAQDNSLLTFTLELPNDAGYTKLTYVDVLCELQITSQLDVWRFRLRDTWSATRLVRLEAFCSRYRNSGGIAPILRIRSGSEMPELVSCGGGAPSTLHPRSARCSRCRGDP